MTFGDKPAAAISAIALRETAELYKHINEEAAAKIKDDMYVDDIATGAANMEGVQRLKEGIKEILAKGGFQVKGFVTSGDVVEDIIAMLGTGEMGRILGIGWNPPYRQLRRQSAYQPIKEGERCSHPARPHAGRNCWHRLTETDSSNPPRHHQLVLRCVRSSCTPNDSTQD